MLTRGSSELVTAVELGSSKICVVLGESDDNGNVIVLGSGERGSEESIRKGEIHDMQKVIHLFNEALSEAEDSAGTEIEPHNVYVSVSGANIRSYHGIGAVPVTGDERRVEQSHINDAVQNASVVSRGSDEAVIEVIAGHFMLDGRRVDTPLDQKGHKLESHCHIICGNSNVIDNLLTPAKDAHIDSPVPVFAGLASAMAMISDEVHAQGAVLLDIGAGTTEYLQFYNPGIRESGVVAVGCDHIVNDLAIALEIPFSPTARELFKAAGDPSKARDGFYQVPGHLGPRKIPRDTVAKIISMRVGELLDIVLERLDKRGGLQQNTGAGIVLTGGGTGIPGIEEAIAETFKMPVRAACDRVPEHFGGAVSSLASPRYSTVLGLLEYGLKRTNRGSIISKLDRNINKIIRSAWKNTIRAFRL